MSRIPKTALIIGVQIAASAAFGQTRITFEEVPSRTELTHQYGAKGVHFDRSTTYDTSLAHSPKNALFSVPPNAEVFSFPGPLVITFDTAQADVRMFAGTTGTQAVTATLTAFDAAGHAIAHDGPRSLPGNEISTLMEVKLAQPAIRRVELFYGPDGNETIDDLEFSGVPVTDVPKTPPDVKISSPSASQPVDTPTFTVQGTVVGKAVDTQAVVRVHIPRPAGSSTTADFSYPVTLTHTAGDTYRFSQVVNLGIGPQTITVDAQNTGGLHGIATVIVDALPTEIRRRFNSDGGTNTFGAFLFGSVNRFADCAYAVYAKGAVASTNTVTAGVHGPIYQKWTSLQDPGHFPNLGCPHGEERTVSGNGKAQDFVGGRIYATGTGAFFVPPVLTSAIDVLGGEAGVGLPIADPTSDSRPVFVTWLFQRFQRTGFALPSTLEIRGNPARLFVERQAGDGSLFANLIRPSNATIVQSFPCTTTAGPCTVSAPPDEPLFGGTAQFCNNKQFDWKQQLSGFGGGKPDPPEWVAIHGDYVQTPIWGVLFDVHLAKGDNPFTHRNHFDPCPTPTLEALINETICPSDWDLKIRPLPGYRSLQAEGRDAVQIEFERVDFQAQLVKYGDPTPGDLIFASGRYNVDCGHGPKFKTEMHPPSVYVAVRSTVFNGHQATEADIWVNRFFAGGTAAADAVEFDIMPPPRPNPQAVLGASLPGNQTGLVQVTITPIAPFGPVHVKATATPGKPEVTKYGEMKPRTDNAAFGYDGRIHVYWSCAGGGC